MSILLDWIEAPKEDAGVRFLENSGEWSLVTYAELARRSRNAAAAIAATELTPGGRIALLLPNGPEFVAAFYGALLAGMTPCPLATPNFLVDAEQYRTHVAGILRVAQPAGMVVHSSTEALAREGAVESGLQDMPIITEVECDGSAFVRANPAELALLQFTSGSSGRPRGARVTRENLEANMGMIADFIGFQPHDVGVSWLPLFHDMGLIGGITIFCNQIDGWLMRPEHFVLWPKVWLERFGRLGATIAVSPSFAFGYAAKRIKPDDLEGSDFSKWRTAITGADRINVRALSSFAELLAPYGFQPKTFAPAYGLAEATLVVTISARDETPHAVQIDWTSLRTGEPVEIRDRLPLGRAQDFADTAEWLVGCGQPPEGVTVEVLGEDGEPLPVGWLGEISVGGVSVVDGYESGETSGPSSFPGDGTIRTGDAGFEWSGELYVIGRLGDSIKIRGRSVFAEDLEARLSEGVSQVRPGRGVVLTGVSATGPTIVGIAEVDPGPWMDEAEHQLGRGLGSEVSVCILSVPAGTIERTSSGKPRRRVMWKRFVEGDLSDVVLASSSELPQSTANANEVLAR
jgi:acyl-CoA synthetase (AMP-forming)/AMP-acid ligase II